ncbi:hypothetical protein HHK36_023742 [Tetracentron sinense]|uniref:B box-type domain-containing protein n=1 Tax=Tetracentron sinense TaxID=13715 RepID=A0A834YN85_TETSI|nr:hypothetical protein HHK36_023742 [Tetracentron sinense]
MYCESDQACLCWDCDAKVHCANFLVERHSRSLLCHVCQSPTPWKASGAKLGPTVSVCEKCVNNSNGRQERDGGNHEESEGGNGEDDDDDDELDEEDYVDEDDDGDDADGENQVVPLSSTPPPPVESSSSSEESSSRFSADGEAVSASAMPFSLKRLRENADLSVEDDPACSSSQPNYNATLAALVAGTSGDDEATSFGSLRPLKYRKRTSETRSAHVQAESRSVALVGSLKRFHQGSGNDSRYLQTNQRSQAR